MLHGDSKRIIFNELLRLLLLLFYPTVLHSKNIAKHKAHKYITNEL